MRQAGIKISLQIKRTFFSSNLLKFTSSDQLEGVIQRPSEALALINNFVSRMQDNSTLASPHHRGYCEYRLVRCRELPRKLILSRLIAS